MVPKITQPLAMPYIFYCAVDWIDILAWVPLCNKLYYLSVNYSIQFVFVWSSLVRIQDILFRQMGVYWSIIMRLESTFRLYSLHSWLTTEMFRSEWEGGGNKAQRFTWKIALVLYKAKWTLTYVQNLTHKGPFSE